MAKTYLFLEVRGKAVKGRLSEVNEKDGKSEWVSLFNSEFQPLSQVVATLQKGERITFREWVPDPKKAKK